MKAAAEELEKRRNAQTVVRPTILQPKNKEYLITQNASKKTQFTDND